MAGTKAKQERIKSDLAEFVSHGSARYVRVTPRKARLVADLIRGKQVGEALGILKFTNRPSAAPHVEKLLKSLAADAGRSFDGDPGDLIIAKIMIDGGPIMKRIQPRAQGRANRILKRTCHITIGLKEQRA